MTSSSYLTILWLYYNVVNATTSPFSALFAGGSRVRLLKAGDVSVDVT